MRFSRADLARFFENYGTVILRTPHFILGAFAFAALAASIVYLAASAYAFFAGWALPTTAALRWWSLGQWLARNEPYFAHVLLFCAGMGAVAYWLSYFHPGTRLRLQRDEAALIAFFQHWGLLIAICWLVLSVSAMWAMVDRPGDFHGASIGGLIAFSDAGGYLASAHDQAKDGTWSTFSLRRPFAAAFRSVLFFFGAYSTSSALLLQAVLLAAVTWFAALAIMKWRGLCAGVTFFAFAYIYTRTFVPTTLTEPLGLFWALFAVPFFVEALRAGAVAAGMVAFMALSIALMTRMGSMFTIPALVVWMVISFGRGAKQKATIAAMCMAALIGIWSTNVLLETAYGTSQASTGSNFSYVICGLSIGTTWDGCTTKYAKEVAALPQTEEVLAKFMYAKAWDNFKSNPEIMISRIASGTSSFFKELPRRLWRGYFAVEEPRWVPRRLLFALSLLAALWSIVCWRNRREVAFWLLLWTSIIASVGFVHFDDGARVMAASMPLIFMFFAMGLTGPIKPINAEVAEGKPSHVRMGVTTIAVAAVLFISIPWLAYRLSPASEIGGDAMLRSNEAIVFGSRRLTGFLVVADGAPLRDDVPTVHLSDFSRMINRSNVEFYQGLINPEAPPLPFGFVFAPRLEKNMTSDFQFIVPAAVMERRDVPAWHLVYRNWQLRGPYGPYWFYVTHAEPFSAPR